MFISAWNKMWWKMMKVIVSLKSETRVKLHMTVRIPSVRVHFCHYAVKSPAMLIPVGLQSIMRTIPLVHTVPMGLSSSWIKIPLEPFTLHGLSTISGLIIKGTSSWGWLSPFTWGGIRLAVKCRPVVLPPVNKTSTWWSVSFFHCPLLASRP